MGARIWFGIWILFITSLHSGKLVALGLVGRRSAVESGGRQLSPSRLGCLSGRCGREQAAASQNKTGDHRKCYVLVRAV